MPDDSEKQILADWARHPGHAVMRKQLLEARDSYYVALGKKLYRTPDELTDADLRNKASFFRGAMYILNTPVFEATKLERALARQEEPDDQE